MPKQLMNIFYILSKIGRDIANIQQYKNGGAVHGMLTYCHVVQPLKFRLVNLFDDIDKY